MGIYYGFKIGTEFLAWSLLRAISVHTQYFLFIKTHKELNNLKHCRKTYQCRYWINWIRLYFLLTFSASIHNHLPTNLLNYKVTEELYQSLQVVRYCWVHDDPIRSKVWWVKDMTVDKCNIFKLWAGNVFLKIRKKKNEELVYRKKNS